MSTLEETYKVATGFYKQGLYQKARPLFKSLVEKKPELEPGWRGLASTLQMLSQWEEAVLSWKISSYLARKDPLPLLHTAECLWHLNHKERALSALVEAKQRASHLSEEAEVSQNIELLMDLIQKG